VTDQKPNSSIAHYKDGWLELFYSYNSEDAIFDICDLSGSILRSGRIKDCSKIDVSDMPKGIYILYIIDDGKVVKEKVQF
jgi:hypothetical protein